MIVYNDNGHLVFAAGTLPTREGLVKLDVDYAKLSNDQKLYGKISGVNVVVDGAAKTAAAAAASTAKMAALRSERNRRLFVTDWTQLPDVQLTAGEKSAYAAYRHELRDLPETTDPEKPDWPVSP